MEKMQVHGFTREYLTREYLTREYLTRDYLTREYLTRDYLTRDLLMMKRVYKLLWGLFEPTPLHCQTGRLGSNRTRFLFCFMFLLKYFIDAHLKIVCET